MRHDSDQDIQILSASVDGDSTRSNMMHLRRARIVATFPWLLALLAVGYVVLHWSEPVALVPDSGGYLQFSEHRTAAYPLFLRAVETLFGTTDAAQKVTAHNRGVCVRLPGLERPSRLPVARLRAGAGGRAYAVSTHRRPARLHPHRVHLHIAAVPHDRRRSSRAPATDLAMDGARRPRLRPGHHRPPGGPQPPGDLALPALAHLEDAPMVAGWRWPRR